MSGKDAISSVGSLGAAQWEAQWQAAQSARVDGLLAAAAGKADKATAQAAPPTQEGKAAQLKQVAKVSQDFESLFLAYMFKTMRQAVPKSDFFGQGQAHEIFTEMRDEELAKGMAKAGGIGLGKLLADQLRRSLDQKA